MPFNRLAAPLQKRVSQQASATPRLGRQSTNLLHLYSISSTRSSIFYRVDKSPLAGTQLSLLADSSQSRISTLSKPLLPVPLPAETSGPTMFRRRFSVTPARELPRALASALWREGDAAGVRGGESGGSAKQGRRSIEGRWRIGGGRRLGRGGTAGVVV